MRALDIDELGRRSGRHAGGYVGPTEAAWEILEETIAPFVQDVARKVDVRLEAEALAACEGVVLGLYRLDHGKAPELLGGHRTSLQRPLGTWSSPGPTGDRAGRRGRRRHGVSPKRSWIATSPAGRR